MIENNYFFIDGSSLLNDIRKLKKSNRELRSLKFNIISFCQSFLHSNFLKSFHNEAYRRIVFYFVANDNRISEDILMPDFTIPQIIEDIQIKYCGKKIAQYKKAAVWLDDNSAPDYVRNSLYKSEKAVDTQICCDAMMLLAINRLDRLFLYSNDFDFIPLCQSIKTMGGNISLIRLTQGRVNKDLVRECDTYNSFDSLATSFFENK